MEPRNNITALKSFMTDIYNSDSDEEDFTLVDQLEDVVAHVIEV